MSPRRCIRLGVPADLHLVPERRDHVRASDLLIADWKLRGAWRHGVADATASSPCLVREETTFLEAV